MVEVLTYTSDDKKKIAKGLASLVPDSDADPAAIDTMADGGVNVLLTMNKQFIDANTRPAKKKRGFFDLFSGGDEAEQPGAKDKLLSYIKAAKDGKLTDAKETSGLESAMAAGGYKVVLDNNISDQERRQLDDFQAKLTSGLSLTSMFNQNYKIAKATAEQEQKIEEQNKADATVENDRVAKYKAGLVYAGYLKPGQDDPRAAAEAMTKFIINDVPFGQGATEQRKMYEDLETFKPNDYALTFLQTHTGNTAQIKVQADLESGDPARITLAQNYMALQGVTVGGAAMQANGQIYSGDFKNAAEQFIRRPLTMPEGIIGPNGAVDTPKLWGMAAAGQLYLPESELKPDELEAAKAYKTVAERGDGTGLSREAFVASILIGNDPKRYEAILAKENEKRAGLTLNSAVEKMAAENVVADVKTSGQKLDAIDLPANLGEKAMQMASQNNGYIKIEQIPYVVAQAQGNATSLTGAIDVARLRGQMAQMSQDDLSRSIKLDPGSPDFKANMIDFMKNAYVLGNAQSGVTMNNIPQDVLGGFKDIADTQAKVSNSLTVGKVQDFGLPSNILSRMDEVSTGGSIPLAQLPILLKQLDPNGIGQKINAANPIGEVYRTNFMDSYGKDPVVNNVIDGGETINVKDPKQLAVALQLAVAIKEGKSFEDVRGRDGMIAQTGAAAEGYLGINANRPDNKPAVTPTADPKGSTISEDRISNRYNNAAGPVVATNDAPADTVTVEPVRKPQISVAQAKL